MIQDTPQPSLEESLEQSPKPKKKNLINYAFDGVGLVTWGTTTGTLYPVIQHYLPIAEKAAQVSVTIPDLPLKLDQLVETAAEGAARISGQGAEATLAGIGALAAGYITFRFFDWLGDDYRPQRMAKWAWDNSGRRLWEHTGLRAINGMKSGAKRAGRDLRYQMLKAKDRVLKGRSAEDYDMAKRFGEAQTFIDEFPSEHMSKQDEE